LIEHAKKGRKPLLEKLLEIAEVLSSTAEREFFMHGGRKSRGMSY